MVRNFKQNVDESGKCCCVLRKSEKIRHKGFFRQVFKKKCNKFLFFDLLIKKK